MALSLCSTYSASQLRQILAEQDASSLKKVKGVGAKSAQRLALELHDKVERIPVPAAISVSSAGVEEAHQALVALGFSAKDAQHALDAVADESDDSEVLLDWR